MPELIRTREFERWLEGLRDRASRGRILLRLERLALGHAGDAKPVGSGVSELRFAFGPGYRVYFVASGRDSMTLLVGGDKSTQSRDIARAVEMAERLGDI